MPSGARQASSSASSLPGPASSRAERTQDAPDARQRVSRPPARLGLQLRAPRNLRRHLKRAALRFAVLLAADMAAFAVMRALLRVVRDNAGLGAWLAELIRGVMPAGILSGWQFAAALVVGLLVTGNYKAGDDRRDPGRLFLGCALATALPLWMTIWTRGVDVVALQYALTVTLVWLGLVAERQGVDRLVAAFRRGGRDAAGTLFVGRARECQAVTASRAFNAGREFKPLGFVDVEQPTAVGAVGHIEDFPVLLAASGAEVVVVCGAVRASELASVVDASLASGCQVLAVPPELHLPGVEPVVQWRAGQPLIQLTAPSLKGWQLLVKRVLDLAGAAAVLVLAGPVMLAITALIRLDSPGPALFRQERVGGGGRRFKVVKFRTMRHGVPDTLHRDYVKSMVTDSAPAAGHVVGNGPPVYKLVNDGRVTATGRWLRAWSLDELPQLFNVLRGEMSLVGPRPPLPYEFEAYDHWQLDRLQVKPGMTGLWQVSGRNLLTYRQMCELDLDYVRRWSLWLDLKILLKTIPVVLFNSGRAR